MSRPLIGITLNPKYPNLKYPYQDLPYDRLAHTYIDAIRGAGGIPLLLPTNLSAEELLSLRDRLDGVLLSGGGDIAPERFNGIPSATISDVCPERDNLEFALVKMSLETDWPLMGICRGIQVINTALGGNLYTDIPSQYDSRIAHYTPIDKKRDYLAHEVTIVAGTRLNEITGQAALQVNSFHHQAVQRVSDRLQVSASASDGLIEGVEIPEQRFFLGVQWHPECLPQSKEQQALFSAFIRAAQRN